MDNLIAVLQSIDPRFTFGWALLWFGVGVATVGVYWGIQKHMENRIAKRMLHTLFGQDGVGHVIDVHPTGNPLDPNHKYVHAHCICGEASLLYMEDDPTAESLMEQWSDNHIDSQMESADV